MLSRPVAAMLSGGRALAPAKNSSVPANSADDSSAQPAPAVARAREPGSPSGRRSMLASRPPTTASVTPT